MAIAQNSEGNLFHKYDVPAPRYTSYPTVPYWSDPPSTDFWLESLNRTFEKKPPWAMYLHIPYCETLCTFCGCNTSITKNHERESPYVKRVINELRSYESNVTGLKSAPLKQIHLGGGTPTFLSPDNLGFLVDQLFRNLEVDSNYLGSIEVDPRRTTKEHLVALRNRGFGRISLGVQDFDPEVQRLVNRVQPYEMTKEVTEISRQLGYDSVNFDLIYGLPTQTEESILSMMEKTWSLKPDRIALYSLAIVPWIKPAQKLFKDSDLPAGREKRRLYEISREFLLEKGYVEIGMDHFALPSDDLAIADKEDRLHRNFMGYVEERTQVLLGLGVSSISETPDCFHQNEKALPVYERRVDGGEIPTLRGHRLSEQDQIRREQILKFMTGGKVQLDDESHKERVRDYLMEMEKDSLVTFNGLDMILTDRGVPFLRNACMALDERLLAKKPDAQVFSKSL